MNANILTKIVTNMKSSRKLNAHGLATLAILLMMTGQLFAQEMINREILPVVPPEPQTYTE